MTHYSIFSLVFLNARENYRENLQIFLKKTHTIFFFFILWPENVVKSWRCIIFKLKENFIFFKRVKFEFRKNTKNDIEQRFDFSKSMISNL